jgi:teichuronic acid exporter
MKLTDTRVAKGFLWNAIEHVFLASTQLLTSIYLARLVLPSEFGVMVLANSILLFAQTAVDAGFNAALIQKPKLDSTDVPTVFWLNLSASVFLAVLIALISQPLAIAMHSAPLAHVLFAMTPIIVLRAISLTPRALLNRNLDFALQARAGLIGSTAGCLTAITAANCGYGIWSLVAQQYVMTLTLVASFPLPIAHIRSIAPSSKSFRSLSGFGSRLFAASLLEAFFQNLNSLAISSFFSIEQLGFFSKAKELGVKPGQTLGTMIAKVAFPVFSKFNEKESCCRDLFLQILHPTIFISFFVASNIAFHSRSFFELFLPQSWEPAIQTLQTLCLVGALYPLHTVHISLLKASGNASLLLSTEFQKKTIILLLLFLAAPFGFDTLIWGQVLASVFAYFLNSRFTSHHINYSYAKQFLDISAFAAAAIVSALVPKAISDLLLLSPTYSLLLALTSSLITVAICACLFWRYRR